MPYYSGVSNKADENKINAMKLSTAQLVARLHYAAHVGSWNNIHTQMKPAMRALIKKGFAERKDESNAFFLTEDGEQIIRENKALMSGGKHNAEGAYMPVVVEGAKYWTDEWSQKIPA